MEEVIINWKLNRVVLASKMSMPQATFNQKLLGHRNSFTKEEWFRLRNILIKLLNELDRATNIDFNDAMKAIIETKI